MFQCSVRLEPDSYTDHQRNRTCLKPESRFPIASHFMFLIVGGPTQVNNEYKPLFVISLFILIAMTSSQISQVISSSRMSKRQIGTKPFSPIENNRSKLSSISKRTCSRSSGFVTRSIRSISTASLLIEIG